MNKNLIFFICFNVIFPFCVTFEVDISNADIPAGNFSVLMIGSWNSWGWGYQLSESENDNIYTGTFCGFSNGEYQYVHSITGDFDSWSGWGMIGNPPLGSFCDFNPNDSYQNYGFTIDNNDIITSLNSWNCCGTNDCSNWDGCLSGAVKTDLSYLYGRFEVRMKSADGDGLVSSFFTYNTDWDQNLGNLNWNEIDIEMTGNRDSSVQFTTHHPGDPNSWSIGEIIQVDFNPHSSFNNYAIEWTPSSIKWFVNDEEVYMQGLSIVDDLNMSQKIMMNLWPSIWEDWTGEWNEEDVPKHAFYDYVKYYEYNPSLGDYGSNNDFLLIWEDHFDTFNNQIWDDNSSDSFNGNLCSFSPLNTNYYNGHLILTLTDINQDFDCNEINGDINFDSITNILDIVITVETILYDAFDLLDTCAKLSVDSDYNQDLNIIDVVFLIDNIVNN